jgi:ribosome-interacting GTPase 1
MPANLTPEYAKAEQRFRQAATDEERLAALQEMLSAIPKHKGTERMQADIKRRISQLRKEQQKSSHGKGPDPFYIPKSGAGQVVLVGPPNTGKSSLLNATTNAAAKVADYPFTTTVPQPGMWCRDEIPIELVDTPPITPDHVPTGLLGTIRSADLICVVVEAGENTLEQVESALAVLDAKGLTLKSVPRHQLNPGDATQRPGLIVINKVEAAAQGSIVAAVGELYASQLDVRSVSARTGQGLEAWFKHLWQLLAVIRVYAKQPGKPPDLQKPFILPHGATIADLAGHIHRTLSETMKHARLWGHGRFEGQLVHKTEPLQDRDVVEIHE